MSKTTGRTVIHVQFRATGKNHYFGSIAAVYDIFDHEQLGIKQNSLYDYNIEPDKPYSNKLVLIRKSEMHRKPGNRAKKHS
jgi:hypothetical protein